MMTLFNLYKEKLFSDETKKKALLESVRNKGYSADSFEQAYANLFFKIRDYDFQKILAPFFRALAIEHLRTADTELTRGFREAFEAAFGGLDVQEVGDVDSLNAFYDQQGTNFTYATDIEAGALAEIFDVNFACTRVGPDHHPTAEPTHLYYRSSKIDPLTINLFNRPGNHFFILDGQYSSTIPDGNCLYNGWAQIAQQYILQEETPGISVILEQQRIYEKLVKSEKTMSLATLIANAMSQVGIKPSEQRDLQAALDLAREEQKLQKVKKIDGPKDETSDTQPEDETPVVRVEARRNSQNFSKFEEQIDLIEQKGKGFAKTYDQGNRMFQSLLDINYKEAADKALSMASKLRKIMAQYKANEPTQKNYAVFNQACMDEINLAKPALEKHRGFKNLLINIVSVLFALGLPFVYNNYRLFNLPTNSALHLQTMQASVDQLQPILVQPV